MSDPAARRLGLSSAALGLTSIALLGAAVWGFRIGGWPWPQAYGLAGWAAWAAGAGVALAVVGAVVWLMRRRGGAWALVMGLVLSLPVAILASGFEIAARLTPPINDVTTDMQDPPVFWFTASPSDYPAENAGPQTAAYPELVPLGLDMTPEAAFDAALALVEARGWTVLSADPGESQIEAIATSRLFGFEDEVAIRVTETDTGARIDLRSRSRLGRIDRGANARRIAAFLADLSARVGE